MSTLFIHGEPQPQPRPRATTVAGNARIYSPRTKWRKTVEAGIRAIIDSPRDPSLPPYPFYSEGQPVQVRMDFYIPRPKSHCKKRGGLVKGAPRYPLSQRVGDTDNLAKLVLDAANGLLWNDDAQVTTMAATKQYVNPGHGGVLIIYSRDEDWDA